MQARYFIALAALSMFLAVAAGAFGAHALKTILSADLLAIWYTAVLYQLVHGLGLLAVGILSLLRPQPALRWSGWAMLFGMLLFSGSLYLLALSGMRALGAVTPVGGVAFLFAWGCLGWAGWHTDWRSGNSDVTKQQS